MCVLRQVYQALCRPCFLGMTGCGLCVCVCDRYLYCLKQLADTDTLNLDMNIIQLVGTLMPYMLIYYYNQFDIVT